MQIKETRNLSNSTDNELTTPLEKPSLNQQKIINIAYSSKEEDTRQYTDRDFSSSTDFKAINYKYHSTLEWLHTWRSLAQ